MYICNECGNVFEEPRSVGEYIDGENYMSYSVSPCCEEDYSEAVECDCCHFNYIPEEEDYCEDCLRDLTNLSEEFYQSFRNLAPGCERDTFKHMVLEHFEERF